MVGIIIVWICLTPKVPASHLCWCLTDHEELCQDPLGIWMRCLAFITGWDLRPFWLHNDSFSLSARSFSGRPSCVLLSAHSKCENMSNLFCGDIIWLIWTLYCMKCFLSSSKQDDMRLEEGGVCFRLDSISRYFIVQILKRREWDVTIQNNEPLGCTFLGSHPVTSLYLLGALQLIAEAPPPHRL